MKYKKFPLIKWYEGKEYSLDLSESGIMGRSFEKYLHTIPSTMVNDYGDTRGEKDFLHLLSKTYLVKEEHFLVTNGATEAIYIALECLLNAYDEVIIATPYFNNIGDILTLKGIEVKECFFDLFSKEDYVDLLISQVTSKTKAILLCSVMNPSGFVITESDYRNLISFTKERGIYLIFDDVFAEFNLQDHKYLIDYQELNNIIHINGLAKVYGAPGLRVGWIVSSLCIIEKIMTVKEYITENTSRISQLIALDILKDRVRLLAENDSFVSMNRVLLKSFCDRHNYLELFDPKGGCCSIIGYRFKENSYDFCNNIYDKTGILLAPGDAFGYKQSFRLGFGINPAIFNKRLDILDRYFKETEEKNEFLQC